MVAICRTTSMGDSSGSSDGQRRRCGKSTSSGSNVEKRAKQDVLEDAEHYENKRIPCVRREEHLRETPNEDRAAEADSLANRLEKNIVERQVVDSPETNSIQILTLPGITLSVTATVTIAFPGGNTLTGSSTPNPMWALPSTVISTETVSVNTETPTWPPPLPTPSLQPVPNPISANPLLASPSAEQPTLSTPAPSQPSLLLSPESPSSSQSPTTTVTSFIPTAVSRDETRTAFESSVVSTIDGSVIVFSYTPTTELTSETSSPATNNSPPGGSPEAAPAPGPDNASSSQENSSGNNDNAKLPPILGGVFGALAGIGLVLWALLFIIRYRKRQIKDTKGNGGNRPILREAPGGASEGGSKKQEMKAILGSGIGTLFGKSSKEPPATEQSFVRVSGRKVTSDFGPGAVAAGKLRSEGPGDDNAIPENPFASNEDALAHAQESNRQSTQATIRASRLSTNEDDEPTITTFRSSLAPSDYGEGASRFPTPPPVVRRLHGSMSGVDGVGRSLPSQDGSKTSRFTEDV